jgi:UDP-N-acetylmuramate dehydrogenase
MNMYLDAFPPEVAQHIRFDEPLSRHTVARLGGAADALYVAEDTRSFAEVVRTAWLNGWNLRVLGGGANVLVSDAGFRGLVVINKSRGLDIQPNGIVTAESGVGHITLARETMAHGLAGYEWAIGVPGTIGGGIVSNAGAHGSDMAANVTDVVAQSFEDQYVQNRQFEHADLKFGYRTSVFKGYSAPFNILEIHFKFEPGHNPDELRAKAESFNAHRKRTQPPGASLGSVFKNPPGDYAGRLIEAAGLKGTQIGGVKISDVHANFIVNVGANVGEQGTAADYLNLINLARETVRQKFGIELELEIDLIGFEHD